MSTLLESKDVVKSENFLDLKEVSQTQVDLIIQRHKESEKAKRLLAKAKETLNTKQRRKLNNDVKSELLNFDDVFKAVIKKKFDFLTSRPTLAKVTENLDNCETILAELCSDKVLNDYNSDKNVVISWERLPRLITDKKLLLTFATTAQRNDGKVWSAQNIIDVLFKGLTAKVQTYELHLKVR